jgi:hypothetical protein
MREGIISDLETITGELNRYYAIISPPPLGNSGVDIAFSFVTF